MKKKILAIMMCTALTASMLVGCGHTNQQKDETSTEVTATDEEAAMNVANLIDKIYVQERTETTDADCKAAKDAWDALTDAQKELVEGENADPDYFGRDTGDASKDDPLNQDNIGDNEILVVSFGTSFNDSRTNDIGGIEKAIAAAYPDWSVRRAFTSQIIINHIQARDGEFIDNIEQALDRAVSNNVKNLVVQPTHLMHGAEYDDLVKAVNSYSDKFESVTISEPLLGPVGASATEINTDKENVAKYAVAEVIANSSFDTLEAMESSHTAIVFMGHGTSHNAKISYSQMQTVMDNAGYTNVFIGTVEGEPEETSCESIIERLKSAGYTDVILRDLMVVAGDHANNDMAGDDDDSWKSMLTAAGLNVVQCQLSGLGSIPSVQNIYVQHLAEVLGNSTAGLDLEDGTYTVKFTTDSSMFHINETLNDEATLTVKDGKGTVHIVLSGTGILNLYVGTAAEAEKSDNLLNPVEETVTYPDGTTETVYAFDVPVDTINYEFDLALIGSKGKWYDHKVLVSNPIK